MTTPVPPGTQWENHLGQRIVVRVRGVGGLSDVLGELIEVDDVELRVLTRRGEVLVDRSAIVAGHPVPPAPARAAPPHRALSVGSLELVAAQHWQAAEQDWLGGWLLRASGGFTNRANSVLAVGEPGMPMDVAVLEVTDWYTERGLRPVATSPEPRLDEEDTEQLLAAAGAFETAGWRPVEGAGALVLTGPTGELRGAGNGLPAGLTAHFQGTPDPDWLALYQYRGQPVPAAGRQLMLSAPEQVFASIRDGARVVGVARGSLAQQWAGLTAMEVAPDYRRQGLARALIAALGEWAWQRGARSMFTQAAETNLTAQQLYLNTGFEAHHSYAYLARPV